MPVSDGELQLERRHVAVNGSGHACEVAGLDGGWLLMAWGDLRSSLAGSAAG